MPSKNWNKKIITNFQYEWRCRCHDHHQAYSNVVCTLHKRTRVAVWALGDWIFFVFFFVLLIENFVLRLGEQVQLNTPWSVLAFLGFFYRDNHPTCSWTIDMPFNYVIELDLAALREEIYMFSPWWLRNYWQQVRNSIYMHACMMERATTFHFFNTVETIFNSETKLAH